MRHDTDVTPRVWVVLAVLACGVGAAALTVTSGRGESPWAAGLLGCAVGWSLIASGLVARRVRPGNRIGLSLVAIGFAWLATYLQYASAEWLSTIGVAVENVYLAGFVFVLLAFPTGRLRSRIDRLLVGAVVLLATGVEWIWLLFAPRACGGCPGNAFRISSRPSLADAILDAQRGAGVALSVLTIGIIAVRWRAASPSARRQASPITWAGTALLAALAASISNDAAGAPLGDVPDLLVAGVLALVPLAVLTVLVRLRLDRATVASLVVQLREAGTPLDLQQTLARTLGDPSLRLAYWLDQSEEYVDRTGRPVAVDQDGLEGVTVIERDGRRIAALVHDRALHEVPGLVDSVGAVVALRLENERLEAELHARANDLQASRARLVEVADRERRRIERDLHDGAQQRLVSVAMTLGLARARKGTDHDVAPLLGEAQVQLEHALAELRALSHGLLPPILRERGLAPALRELAKRSPLDVLTTLGRLPSLAPAAEAALYYVVSEALTNTAKHAGADAAVLTLGPDGGGVRVTVADRGCGGADPAGSGLRGLADRVGALGGTFAVRSSDTGTTVEAWIPCGSS